MATTTLPDTWNLHNKHELQEALDILMPGPWQQATYAKLANIIKNDGRFTSCVLTSPGEIQRLYQDLEPNDGPPIHINDIELLLNDVTIKDEIIGMDPFSGQNTISIESKKFGYKIITNDINPNAKTHFKLDAAQPQFYKDMVTRKLNSFFITSPWFPILDIVLPLMVAFAKNAAFVHVPGYYISCAPKARLNFFAKLAAEERIHFIYGLPRGPAGFGCVWICVFKNKITKDQYLIKKKFATISF
jgi:hypothetical protein